MESVKALMEFLLERGMPLQLAHIKREHIEGSIPDLLERPQRVTGKPAIIRQPDQVPIDGLRTDGKNLLSTSY